jgi:hypothetical protein
MKGLEFTLDFSIKELFRLFSVILVLHELHVRGWKTDQYLLVQTVFDIFFRSAGPSEG